MSNSEALTTQGWSELAKALIEAAKGGERRRYTAAEMFKPAQILVEKDGAFAMDSCVPDDYAAPYFGPMGFDMVLDYPSYIAPFMGYARIAQLHQDMIYQNVISTYAEEMTQNWVVPETEDEELLSTDMCKEVQQEALRTWRLDALVRDAWNSHFGWDGGGLIFIDIEGHDSDAILEQELVLDPQNIKPGSLRGFRVVEAINCQPWGYDASNPLLENYFNPTHWRILGRPVHKSRFLYFTQNHLPSILKPLYNFFGVPWVQMLEPYRSGFEVARTASLDSIRNHALLYFKTNLASQMQEGCEDGVAGLRARIQLFNQMRTNDGCAVVDSKAEDFAQIVTPLTDLANLVTLNLELMAMVTREPVTKIFGTPPPGMDASGDNYKEDWAKVVYGTQMRCLHEPVVQAYKVIQLNKWGKIFEPMRYRWPKVIELSADEKLEQQLKRAQVDQIYLQLTGNGDTVLAPQEVRGRLSQDEDSGYAGIETEMPEEYRENGDEMGEGDIDADGQENPPPSLDGEHAGRSAERGADNISTGNR